MNIITVYRNEQTITIYFVHVCLIFQLMEPNHVKSGKVLINKKTPKPSALENNTFHSFEFFFLALFLFIEQ